MSKYKIKDLFHIEKGTLQSSKNVEGEYDFITASTEWKTHETYSHECEALIFAMGASGSLGRTHYANGKFISSDLCFILTPKEEFKDKLLLKLYYYYFNFNREEIVKLTATGTSKKAINLTNFSNYEIDYVDNQQEALKKIEMTLPKTEELINTVNFNDKLIGIMKDKILEVAINGDIVPQNPKEESASILLEKYYQEKNRLIREKKISKEKALAEITEDEIPYELPAGWVWERIGNVFSTKSGSTPLRGVSKYYESGTINWVKTRDLNNGYVVECEEQITELAMDECNLQVLPKNTVCIAMYGGKGTIGKVGILGFETTINQSVCALLPNEYIDSKYMYYYLLKIRPEWMRYASGSRVDPNINRQIIRNMLIPIPPLEEQKRIVEKVDKLIRFYEELKEVNSKSKSESENIMKSVLQKAFIN